MQRSAVALVLRKSVYGKLPIEVEHQAISRDLCEDARCRDGKAEIVSIDQRGMHDGKAGNRAAVDQHVIGSVSERLQRQPHGKVRRLQDIQPINIFRRDHSH